MNLPRILAAFGSADMNPSLDPAAIARLREADPEGAVSEIDAEFRDQRSPYLDADRIDGALEHGVQRREPCFLDATGTARRYHCFVDPAGGGSNPRRDSYAAAIASARSDGGVQLDALLEVRPPFSVVEASAQVAALAKLYHCSQVRGDAYGGEWPASELAKHGVLYQVSEKSASQIYIEAAVLFNASRVHLLDSPRLVKQLRALERVLRPGQRDLVRHPRNQHDDCANACTGALVMAAASRGTLTPAQMVEWAETCYGGSLLHLR
jgi:hypothetical protein